jgi:CRISPR-associated protein Cas5d
MKQRSGRTDHCQRLYDLFNQRLSAGQTFYTPCLGWKEFVPTYFGPLIERTRPDASVNLLIPSLLHSMWQNRQLKPTFRQDVKVAAGVMWYGGKEAGDAQ